MNIVRLALGLILIGLLAVAGGRGAAAASAAPDQGEVITGKVLETMNAASYTYVFIDTGAKKLWAAAPQFAVKTGDTVAVAGGMPMANYHSKTLNRTFEVVFFSGDIRVNGARPAQGGTAADLPKDHGVAKAPAAPAGPDLTGIKRAANGQTVAEIVTGKAKFAGKPIAVRGRVVKFNAMIMGKNWLHIRDGSGTEGTNDLTVTTSAGCKVGDLVLVTGVLAADRDFGSGYKYPLIVENATVVVE